MSLGYSTDKLNRLIVTKDGERYPVDGEFRVEKNTLIFEPYQKSESAKKFGFSKRLRFEGAWRLNKNKDLKLVLSETKDQVGGDEIEIRGSIIAIDADAIVFQMRSVKEQGIERISLLRLSGRWFADEFNQLAFAVTRDIKDDILKFSGLWQINDNQQITYTYQKQDLLTKTKTTEALTFRGYWQINSENRLAYVLDLRNKSFFEFRVGLESPNLVGKTGEIRYRIGIGAREGARENIFSLFGAWKLNRTKSILFEVDYGEGKIRAITFGASARLGKKNEIIFELKNTVGEGLGMSVGFERRFFKNDADVFARIEKLEEELRIEGGVRFRW